jgi:TM2 domain-containing membrane protein YozV
MAPGNAPGVGAATRTILGTRSARLIAGRPRARGPRAETSSGFERIPHRELDDSEEIPMRNPILAAVLSLIIAGLGQIYNGQIGKGVIFIILQLINGALTVVLIGWILMPIVGLWAAIDAYLTAKRNNERYALR